MARHNKPHAGSLAYIPKKRAKSIKPRIHTWPQNGKAMLLGFSAYKAGMTHAIAVDDRKTGPTAGMEVCLPVTILEAPPMKVVGVRVYSKGYEGSETFTDIWCENPEDNIKKKISLPKKTETQKRLEALKKEMGSVSDIRIITYTQPYRTNMPKKTPDVNEIALGGTTQEKLDYATKVLGKELTVRDAFSEKQFIDVTSVTKGKGFQGNIRRYGVKKQPRKSTKKRRHIGTGGAWTPSKKMWTEHQPGQLGFFTRTEYNKFIVKIGDNGIEVTPKGGFLRYGPVQNTYIMVYGSVPGPAKRIIRITHPRRTHKPLDLTVKRIDTSSKQGA
ncbi:MAG: 50S ribosomal protein L3 [Candidatus Altiarchaeota archaeon]|nr:50S ribosomal protein L3 [Candidatus Altiarchaeota archaeon]